VRVIIPIGHDQSIRRLPWVTISIAAICTIVQLYAQFGAPSLMAVSENLALLDKIPVWRLGYHTDDSRQSLALVTSAFVHAGWLHLIGNMLFLWLVGSVLEDRWGRAKFLLFYVASAVVANLAFAAVYHGPTTILVGASGAISGVMGAFLVYYASTQITFAYWMMMRTGTFRLAAYFALPLWLAEQILWFYLDREDGAISGVAYAAHIGGFVFGVAFALATNLIYGKRDHEDDEPAEPPLPVATAHRQTGAIRTQGSREILDLARAGDHVRVLAAFEAVAKDAASVPLTDGAFTAVALAADAAGDAEGYERIAAMFDHEHPTSTRLPKVLWRLAERQRDAGRIDDAVVTLGSLARRFPDDPSGARAAEALQQRAAR